MHGPPEEPGVYARALQDLFAATAADGGNAAADGARIAVAMLEIYMEEVRDLLAPGRGNRTLEISGLGAGQLAAGALEEDIAVQTRGSIALCCLPSLHPAIPPPVYPHAWQD